LFSCKEASQKVMPVEEHSEEIVEEVVIKGNDFTKSIENAHHKEAFLSKNSVSYEIEVAFGGNTILEGTVTQRTNGAKIRIDKKDGTKIWGEAIFYTAKLTFEKGTGDAPDDWYIVYKNPKTNVLEGAAYIVSFGKGVEEAEKEPHAIKFNDFTIVEGIPLATNWTFHLWTDVDGYGGQIGEVKLKNIKFGKYYG